jgi:hypothetical protein
MFLQSIFQPILESELTFPTLECFHIAGFALGVGTIALVDFRILGLAMPAQKTSAVAADLSRWTLLGLLLVFLSAGGLFYSDPDLYYLNPSFQLKMTLLLAALIFHYTVRQPKAFQDDPAKWPAAVSLLLWSGIVFCGIFIAFTGEAE